MKVPKLQISKSLKYHQYVNIPQNCSFFCDLIWSRTFKRCVPIVLSIHQVYNQVLNIIITADAFLILCLYHPYSLYICALCLNIGDLISSSICHRVSYSAWVHLRLKCTELHTLAFYDFFGIKYHVYLLHILSVFIHQVYNQVLNVHQFINLTK